MDSEVKKIKTNIENSFELEVAASYTLNFLVYIQNVYLNQNKDDFRFPYLSKKLLFNDDFEKNYKILWDKVADRLSGNDLTADIKLFYDKREVFYTELLIEKKENLMTFKEVYTAFQTWWDSFVGKFTLERSVENPIEDLYKNISNWLIENKKVPKERLRIHLTYDDCELVEPTCFSYFVIVPIQAFSLRSKELPPKIYQAIV